MSEPTPEEQVPFESVPVQDNDQDDAQDDAEDDHPDNLVGEPVDDDTVDLGSDFEDEGDEQ